MRWARQVGSLAVIAGFLAFTTATSKPKKSTGEASTPSALPSSTASAGPADVDPAAVWAALGCASKAGNVGCKLLDEFAAAATPELGDAVWFGETNAIG